VFHFNVAVVTSKWLLLTINSLETMWRCVSALIFVAHSSKIVSWMNKFSMDDVHWKSPQLFYFTLVSGPSPHHAEGVFDSNPMNKQMVTIFGYPRACRFQKHQFEIRSWLLPLPTFFKTWFKFIKYSQNWPKLVKIDRFSNFFGLFSRFSGSWNTSGTFLQQI
jgi:hypothetical protein